MSNWNCITEQNRQQRATQQTSKNQLLLFRSTAWHFVSTVTRLSWLGIARHVVHRFVLKKTVEKEAVTTKQNLLSLFVTHLIKTSHTTIISKVIFCSFSNFIGKWAQKYI